MNNNRKTYKAGLLEGREQRALEIARALKREGIPEDVVYRMTSFKGEELEKEVRGIDPSKKRKTSGAFYVTFNSTLGHNSHGKH